MLQALHKKCYSTGPGSNVIKLFKVLMYDFYNKVECLFPAKSDVCGPGHEPTSELSTLRVLHLGRLQNYLQTLDSAGKACQGQTLLLVTKNRKLRP